MVDLAGPSVDLCQALDGIRDQKSRLDELRAVINDELLARMDHERHWTIRLPGGRKASSVSPEGEEFDGAALYDDLLRLVDEKVIPIEAVNRAVRQEITFKVLMSGVAALRKGGGRAAEVVERHARRVPRNRYVKLT